MVVDMYTLDSRVDWEGRGVHKYINTHTSFAYSDYKGGLPRLMGVTIRRRERQQVLVIDDGSLSPAASLSFFSVHHCISLFHSFSTA